MITKEEIERVLLWFPSTLTGNKVRRLFGEVLKERDESLAEAREWKEKCLVYREVTIRTLRFQFPSVQSPETLQEYVEKCVDAEMERIRGKG